MRYLDAYFILQGVLRFMIRIRTQWVLMTLKTKMQDHTQSFVLGLFLSISETLI